MTSLEILTLTVSILSFIAAAGAALYARIALEKSQKANDISAAALRFQVLVPALTDYMSADMYIAIGSLWNFYKVDPDTLADRFVKQRNSDQLKADALAPAQRMEFIKTTVDYHRRQVGQFYGLLTSIHDEGGHQRKWLYTYWRKRELQIIPKIIIPLEAALALAIGTEAPVISNERLKRLYDDCPS
jgi:hypothetical protein